jgi:hypothetical protein
MTLPDTVQLNEIAYTFVNAVGLFISISLLTNYIVDLRLLYKHKSDGVRREVAWSAVRNELGRLFVFLGFTVIGLIAMTTIPSPNAGASTARAVSTVIFFSLALYKMWCSVKDSQTRYIVAESLKRRGERGGMS